MPSPTQTDRLAELREACGYSSEEECSVDALIGYKDALEDIAYGAPTPNDLAAAARIVRAHGAAVCSRSHTDANIAFEESCYALARRLEGEVQ